MNSKLFVLEGCEAVGKTTQLKRLEAALKEMGLPVMLTLVPGGTVIGEKVRAILLDPTHADTIQPVASLLLFNASRHQWMHEVVKPALAAGHIVLSDRSFLSTMVYQSYVEELDPEFVESVCLQAVNNILPDKIFLLDISLGEMHRRLSAGAQEKTTRYDVKDNNFHAKVREGYLAQMARFPGLIEKIDGEQPVKKITEQILEHITAQLV